MEFKFIPSKNGGHLLVVNNFYFRRTKQVNEVEYWTCLACNVKAITSNRVVRGDITGEHTHPVDTTGNALRETTTFHCSVAITTK